MPTMKEAAQAAASELYHTEMKRHSEQNHKISMLHHISITQASQTGFVIRLIDGTVYKALGGDFFFTDGLSIITDNHRVYFPTTSISSITILNPGENKS